MSTELSNKRDYIKGNRNRGLSLTDCHLIFKDFTLMPCSAVIASGWIAINSRSRQMVKIVKRILKNDT